MGLNKKNKNETFITNDKYADRENEEIEGKESADTNQAVVAIMHCYQLG